MTPNLIALTKILEESHTHREAANMLSILGYERARAHEGSSAMMYFIEGYVLKIGISENFSTAFRASQDSKLSRFLPKIHWIHPLGFACVCDFVEIKNYQQYILRESYHKILTYIRKSFEQQGFGLWDLHETNFVQLKSGKHMIVDYGCVLPRY